MALSDNLISAWKLDEASGTRADAYGVMPLTDNNTVTQAAGKIEAHSAQFTAANNESLSHADHADLSTGNIDFTFSVWFYPDSYTVDYPVLFGKDDVSTQREYNCLIFHQDASNLAQFYVSANDGLHAQDVFSAAVSTGAWHHLFCWHASGDDLIGIQLDGDSAVTDIYAFGASNTTSIFEVGNLNGSLPFNGRIEQLLFWKRLLTDPEKTYIYNGGAGRTFTEIAGIETRTIAMSMVG